MVLTFYTPCPIFWQWIPKSVCLRWWYEVYTQATFELQRASLLHIPPPQPTPCASITKQQRPMSHWSPCLKLWQEQTSLHHQPPSTSESPLKKLQQPLGLLWIWKNDKLQGSLGWDESSGLWKTDKNSYQLEPDKYSGYFVHVWYFLPCHTHF